MGIWLVNWFTKITGWPAQWVCFRTKVLYQNRKAQSRRIRGAAIIICNHTSVFDYAVLMFVFISRTLRVQMAELLFTGSKRALGIFLHMLGGIRVDRNSHDFGFVAKSEAILRRGGVVGIFPESRLPKPGEERPLPFKPSAAYLALMSGARVIPVYTNGSYFNRHRAKVVIGEPFYAQDLAQDGLSEKENIAAVTEAMRSRIIALGKYLEEYPDER